MTVVRGGKAVMYDIVEGIHKALRIESTWAFVLVVAIGAGLVGGFFAWVIDVGYRNSAEYKAEHLPKQQAVTTNNLPAESATATPAPTETARTTKKSTKQQHVVAASSQNAVPPLIRRPEPVVPTAGVGLSCGLTPGPATIEFANGCPLGVNYSNNVVLSDGKI